MLLGRRYSGRKRISRPSTRANSASWWARSVIRQSPPNSEPDGLPLAVAAFNHLIGSAGSDDFGLGTVFPDRKVSQLVRCRGRGIIRIHPARRSRKR